MGSVASEVGHIYKLIYRHDENKGDVLWEKIGIMFENKNVVNRVSVFRKIVRLRY